MRSCVIPLVLLFACSPDVGQNIPCVVPPGSDAGAFVNAVCHDDDIANAPLVYPREASSSAPVMAGGTITAGAYVLTEAIRYTAHATGSSFSLPIQILLMIDEDGTYRIASGGEYPQRSSGRIVACDGVLVFDESCGGNGQLRGPYSSDDAAIVAAILPNDPDMYLTLVRDSP